MIAYLFIISHIGKFAAMHRTVLLLKKYGQILAEKTQFLFNAAPGRWNNLKTKVSLAKQRLGPRIQACPSDTHTHRHTHTDTHTHTHTHTHTQTHRHTHTLEKNSIDFEQFSGFKCISTTNSRFFHAQRNHARFCKI